VKYDLLVDGERVARVDSEADVREWITRYRQDHEHDDPAATHVQILERPPLAWLRGGNLVDRERFL
jgi:phenylpyruvate tautomerase PptA (4-oxalocrotonate tautomerase family)